MAEDINSVSLVGRLVRDSELQYTTNGVALSKLVVAVNSTKKKGEQWLEEANFFDLILWGKQGEALNPYLKKGQQVGIIGKLKQERWEKDGNKRSRITIEIATISLLGSRK